MKTRSFAGCDEAARSCFAELVDETLESCNPGNTTQPAKILQRQSLILLRMRLGLPPKRICDRFQ
jgi:hypothetical protein